MGSITISSPGLDKLVKRFPVKIKKVMRDSLDQSALVVQNKAKQLAPVLTGHLRRSITRRITSTEAVVGTDVIYAGVREFKTRSIPGGYLRPALSTNKKKIKKVFEKNIQKLLKYK